MASISQLRPSTSTPEYVTFRKCYPTIINYMSEHLGHFCDKLFSKGYISPEVRDQARNSSKTKRERAQTLADTLIDRIEQKPSVFHDFIKIIEEDGPCASDFIVTLKKCHEAEEKLQEQAQKTKVPEKDKELPQAENTGESARDERQEQTEHAGDSAESEECHSHSDTSSEPFPHHEGSLSEQEKIDLQAKLKSDIRNIKKRFSTFTVDTRKSLDGRISLDEIKDTILSLDAFTDGIGVKVLDPQDTQKIELADSLSKVFITLRKYISFFNYEIIEQLIDHYGTNDDKRRLQEYCTALNAFCQRNVLEIPPKDLDLSNPRPEAKRFVLKCTKDTLKLSDIQTLKEKIAIIMGLNPSTLQLYTIEEGCVELHFLISAAVADHIFPVSPSQHSALSEIGVRVIAGSHPETESIATETTDQKPDEFLSEESATISSIQGSNAMATSGYEPESSVTWDTGSGKYCYAAHGKTEVLFIVPSFSGQSPAEVVPRRPQKELSEDEQRKLEHQGVPRECHHDDLSIMKARYGLDKERSISEVMTGGSLTCERVTEKITRLMNRTRAALVILHYIGPGKNGTGDWCFSDGFISFLEIMNLYMTNPHFRGRALTIISDCSYSGNWLREAMAFMDEQGAGPCGHLAKEKRILVEVLSSCQPHEIPTELKFSVHNAKNDKNTGDIMVQQGLHLVKLHDGQHPCGITFTEVRCKNKIDQPCTMTPGSTWQKWTLQWRIRIHVEAYNTGERKWFYVLLVDDNETLCYLADNLSTVSYTDYGMVIARGQGQPPSIDELPQQVKKQYYINYDYQPSFHASN